MYVYLPPGYDPLQVLSFHSLAARFRPRRTQFSNGRRCSAGEPCATADAARHRGPLPTAVSAGINGFLMRGSFWINTPVGVPFEDYLIPWSMGPMSRRIILFVRSRKLTPSSACRWAAAERFIRPSISGIVSKASIGFMPP